MPLQDYLFGSAVVVLFVLCSGAGLVFVRRLERWRSLTRHHEVLGYLFPVAATVYGVLLGLIVVSAMNVFDKAQETVNEESNNLIALFMLAQGQPEPVRERLRLLSQRYAEIVLDLEWNEMDMLQIRPETHPERQQIFELFREIIRLSEHGTPATTQMLTVANDLWKARRERMDLAMRHMPTVVWVVLCLGGVLIVLFSYLFVMDSLVVQLTSTILLATLIGLNLYLVVLFQSPFSGDLRVSDLPMRGALNLIREAP